MCVLNLLNACDPYEIPNYSNDQILCGKSCIRMVSFQLKRALLEKVKNLTLLLNFNSDIEKSFSNLPGFGSSLIREVGTEGAWPPGNTEGMPGNTVG